MNYRLTRRQFVEFLMNNWERGRYTLNLFHTVSLMSKRGTQSEYAKIPSRPVRTVHIFSVPSLLETISKSFNMTLKQNIRAWSGEQNHPRGQKEFKKLRIRMMLNLFNKHHVIHKEFVSEEKTVNTEFYRQVLLRSMRPQF
jgi:hypothetical protein